MNSGSKNKSKFEYYNELYINSPIAYQSLNEKGEFVEVNKKWLTMLGYKKSEVIGKKFSSLLYRDSLASFKKSFVDFKNNGKISNKIFILKCKNGSIKKFSFEGKIFFDEKLGINRTHCVMTDISREQSRADELKKSEEKYRTLSEMLTEAVVVVQGMKVVYVNKRLEEMSGYPANKLNLRSFASFIHPEDKKNLIKKQLKRMAGFKGEMDLEFRAYTSKGKLLHLKSRSGYILWEGLPASINVISNVTQETEDKQKLLDVIEMNEQILRNAPVGFYVVEEGGKLIYINRKMIEISGLKKEKIVNIDFFNYKPYRDIGLSVLLKQCLKGKKFELKGVEYIAEKGGRNSFRNFIGIPLENNGKKNALIIVEDITELKENELKIKNTATEWSQTFDSMSDGISIHSPECVITNVNKAICDMFDLNREEIIGKKCYKLFHKKNSSINNCPLKKTLLSKKKEYLEYYEETLGKWLRVSVSPVLGEDNNVKKIVHIVTDISERKKTEDDIKKRNKELEFFNNLAVDRELKMIELKKEINKLKSKLD